MVVAGLVNDPFTAEAYSPELVGQRRSIVLGKKSGKASIEFKLREMGVRADEAAISSILAEVKDKSIVRKRALTEDEFRSIVQKFVPEPS
jgi:isopropylmalate/homocitrate/citramalate synthase